MAGDPVVVCMTHQETPMRWTIEREQTELTAESVHTGHCRWHLRTITTPSLQSATVEPSETFVLQQRGHRGVIVLYDNTCSHVARTVWYTLCYALEWAGTSHYSPGLSPCDSPPRDGGNGVKTAVVQQVQ
jgi:hypothetical protein